MKEITPMTPAQCLDFPSHQGNCCVSTELSAFAQIGFHWLRALEIFSDQTPNFQPSANAPDTLTIKGISCDDINCFLFPAFNRSEHRMARPTQERLDRTRGLVRAELARRNIANRQLIALLADIRVKISEQSLAN